VREIADRHGVPYRAEPLHRRMWQMLDVVVAKTTMPRVTAHPAEVVAVGMSPIEQDAVLV
jgi:hypothetical protein